ncbi:hypothetical protein [Collimonas sp.]|jgi:hypothetical protein|uniref:defense against restriction DarA-related protein n=1 Tax=Collimonas sp. TaxID=1963772 RepID=UPI002BC6966E|nr:hypothetical protein [Collimonas sp.]HWX02375.1 hypothetical protein [Collimonas sp.]
MDEFTRIEADARRGAMGHNNLAEPTQAQKLAGNYKVGRTVLHGVAIAIEQPRGSFRSGVDAAGSPWQNRMSAHYGYLVGTTGNDGDALDVFIGYFPESRAAFVINQVDQQTGAFDEHKIMLGFPDAQAASCSYLESYHRGWQGLGDIVSISIPQLTWWAKHGNHTKPINTATLPILGYETMNKVIWDGESPVGKTFDGLLYDIRRHDGDGLMYDPLSVTDILDDAEGVYTFDALVTPFAKLERKMQILQNVMERTGGGVKPVAMQITEPFKQRGTANVAVVYELSDGQTLSIFFHNPDVTPQKIAPTDDLISWKWMLNKKDVTIVAAPERGVDLNVREVANRLMRLAERNSATFQRANAKRSARMQAIDALKTAITEKEATLARLQRELEVRRVEKEFTPIVPGSIGTAPAAPISDPVAAPVTEPAPEPAAEPIVVVTAPPEPVADPVSVEMGDVAPEEIVSPLAIETPEGSNSISEEELPPAAVVLVPTAPTVVAVDPVVEADPAMVEPMEVVNPVVDLVGEPTPVPESQPEVESPKVAEAILAPADITQEVAAVPAGASEPTLVEQSAPAISEPPAEMTTDEAFLQSVIDGRVDIFDPALSANIEAILARNSDNAEILAKWQRAVSTYTAAMMAAASQTLSN